MSSNLFYFCLWFLCQQTILICSSFKKPNLLLRDPAVVVRERISCRLRIKIFGVRLNDDQMLAYVINDFSKPSIVVLENVMRVIPLDSTTTITTKTETNSNFWWSDFCLFRVNHDLSSLKGVGNVFWPIYIKCLTRDIIAFDYLLTKLATFDLYCSSNYPLALTWIPTTENYHTLSVNYYHKWLPENSTADSFYLTISGNNKDGQTLLLSDFFGSFQIRSGHRHQGDGESGSMEPINLLNFTLAPKTSIMTVQLLPQASSKVTPGLSFMNGFRGWKNSLKTINGRRDAACYLPQIGAGEMWFGNIGGDRNPAVTQNTYNLCMRLIDSRDGVEFEPTTNNMTVLGGSVTANLVHVVRTGSKAIQTCPGLRLSSSSISPLNYKELFNVTQDGKLVCGMIDNFLVMDYFTSVRLDIILDYKEKILPHKHLIVLRKDDGKMSVDETEFKSSLTPRVIQVYDRNVEAFECTFVSYLVSPDVVWTVTFRNGTRQIVAVQQYDEEDAYFETVKQSNNDTSSSVITFQTAYLKHNFSSMATMDFSCAAYYWNRPELVESFYHVQMKDSEPPLILWVSRDEKMVQKSGTSIQIPCKLLKGKPNIKFQWTKDGRNVTNNNHYCITVERVSEMVSVLKICNADPVVHDGIYGCHAANYLGATSKQISLTILKENKYWIFSMAVAFLILIIIASTVVSWRLYQRQRNKLSKEEIDQFMKGKQSLQKDVGSDCPILDIIESVPYDHKKFEISWANFKEDTDDQNDGKLGEGEFGVVLKGLILDTMSPVAAKTIRENSDKATLLAILCELKIMIYLDNSHENIVQFLGSCTQFLHKGRVHIFLEFCDLGDLRSFLKKHRTTYSTLLLQQMIETPEEKDEETIMAASNNLLHYVAINNEDEMLILEDDCDVQGEENVEMDLVSEFSATDLTQWSLQIARGMSFLESRRVVHADLAARNVLLKSRLTVKITDFGLSRRLYSAQAYEKKSMTGVPWRWLAIESLRDQLYTSKSDVWSFGVTVWEIFSLGSTPYPCKNWTDSFIDDLEQGYRPLKPKYSTEKIYKVLQNCWKQLPEDRPGFGDLVESFQRITEESMKPASNNGEEGHTEEEEFSTTSF